MPTNDTRELAARARAALEAEYESARSRLKNLFVELAKELVAQTEALAELEPNTVDMLERASAVWIGDVTIPKESVRAAMQMFVDGGRYSWPIGPSGQFSREMLPELKPGKFRVVCFAIRTGDAEGPTQRDV